MADRFALEVRGRQVTGWTQATWTRATTDVCSMFSCSVMLHGDMRPEDAGIVTDEPCAVSIAGVRLIEAGVIESVTRVEDASGLRMDVVCRDGLIDALESSADIGWSLQKVSALDVAQKLMAAHGYEVSAQAGLQFTRREKVAITQGQSGWEVLGELLKFDGILARARGKTLELYLPGSESSDYQITNGQGYISGTAGNSRAEQFSEYDVRATQQGSWSKSQGQAVSKLARATRRLIIQAERASSPAECRKRADWERATREAKEFSCETQFRGFGPSASEVWNVGALFAVKLPRLLLDASLVLGSASVSQSSDGTISSLNFMRPGAFLPERESGSVQK